MKHCFIALMAAVIASPSALGPDDRLGHPGHADSAKPAAEAQASGAPTTGEVSKVDREQGKITLRHGEIKNLDMPPMTMVFKARDAALLDKIKPGDKVEFTAEKIGGEFFVTAIEPRK